MNHMLTLYPTPKPVPSPLAFETVSNDRRDRIREYECDGGGNVGLSGVCYIDATLLEGDTETRVRALVSIDVEPRSGTVFTVIRRAYGSNAARLAAERAMVALQESMPAWHAFRDALGDVEIIRE